MINDSCSYNVTPVSAWSLKKTYSNFLYHQNIPVYYSLFLKNLLNIWFIFILGKIFRDRRFSNPSGKRKWNIPKNHRDTATYDQSSHWSFYFRSERKRARKELSYHLNFSGIKKSCWRESDPWPPHYQCDALPTEPQQHHVFSTPVLLYNRIVRLSSIKSKKFL